MYVIYMCNICVEYMCEICVCMIIHSLEAYNWLMRNRLFKNYFFKIFFKLENCASVNQCIKRPLPNIEISNTRTSNSMYHLIVDYGCFVSMIIAVYRQHSPNPTTMCKSEEEQLLDEIAELEEERDTYIQKVLEGELPLPDHMKESYKEE